MNVGDRNKSDIWDDSKVMYSIYFQEMTTNTVSLIVQIFDRASFQLQNYFLVIVRNRVGNILRTPSPDLSPLSTKIELTRKQQTMKD